MHVSWRTAPKPFVNRNWRPGAHYVNVPQFVEKHTMETPVKDVCVAHFRDRGPEGGDKWENCKPNVGGTFQGSEEYDYWYRNGQWSYRHGYDGAWLPLALEFKEMKA